MGQYEQFKKVTKKLKFRGLKSLRNDLQVIEKQIMYRLKGVRYVICNYLSNKNIIIKKYKYEDYIPQGEVYRMSDSQVIGDKITGLLVVDLQHRRFINKEYFYIKTKKGEKRILTVTDTDQEETHCYGHLENIHVLLSGEHQHILVNDQNSPKIRFLQEPTPTFFCPSNPLEKPKVQEYEVDLTSVKNLRVSYITNECTSDIKFIFDTMKNKMEQELEKIHFTSLIRR